MQFNETLCWKLSKSKKNKINDDPNKTNEYDVTINEKNSLEYFVQNVTKSIKFTTFRIMTEYFITEKRKNTQVNVSKMIDM